MKNAVTARTGLLWPILALALMITQTHGQQLPGTRTRPPAPINRQSGPMPPPLPSWCGNWGAKISRGAQKASQELAKLDEVPDALSPGRQDADQEVARRAMAAIVIITVRVDEREFQAMVRDLNKVELDRFVRRMVTDANFAGDRQWQIIQAIAAAVTREANKLAERQLNVPNFDVKTMQRLLLNNELRNLVSVRNAVILSAGSTPRTTSIANSIVIIDGDFGGATGLDNSLLIVRGNVGRCTSIRNSIILATGVFDGATGCDQCFLQVDNHRLRFTSSNNCVFLNSLVKTTGPTAVPVLNADRGPLQLLKFTPRKTDAQLAWGKEVNNLTVAITPAEQKDKFLLRWKNVGADAMELSWIRLKSNPIHKDRDDLWNHVFLKGPDGKMVAARINGAARWTDTRSWIAP